MKKCWVHVEDISLPLSRAYSQSSYKLQKAAVRLLDKDRVRQRKVFFLSVEGLLPHLLFMSPIFSISEFALSLVDVMKTSVGFSNWESQSETPSKASHHHHY